MYKHGFEHGFKPFYNKAIDVMQTEKRAFVERIIRANRQHLSAFAYTQTGDGNADTHQIEAVHSALLVHDHLAPGSDPITIVDGDEQKAIPLVKALSALQTDLPAIVHCLQAEYYYPSMLLADLAASYLAQTVENGEYDYINPVLRTPHAKETRSNDWGRAFTGLYRTNTEYSPAELPNRRGDSVRERICCW